LQHETGVDTTPRSPESSVWTGPENGLRLTDSELATYERDGVLFVPSLFSRTEMERLREELRRISRLEREEINPHGCWALERYSKIFARLLHHPRLLEPARQILGSEVYHHQLKIVRKKPSDSLFFRWHHDYGSWSHFDGMPTPRALNIALNIDPVDEFNGPLCYIPGSHRAHGGGPVPFTPDLESVPLIDPEIVARCVEAGGIVSPKGPPGGATFFHAALLHGSSQSMAPYTRNVVYVTFNRLDNALRHPQRPDYMGTREVVPLELLGDDCLLRP
jgi:ectoine hydroxylase